MASAPPMPYHMGAPPMGGPPMQGGMMPPPGQMQQGVPPMFAGMPGVVPPPPRIPKRPPPTEPCQTLYIRNLPETRATKTLETALKAIFAQYGDVLSIRMKRNIKQRGQAFVTFAEVESATKALKEVQGFPLSMKPMVGRCEMKNYSVVVLYDVILIGFGKQDIQYARRRSDVAAAKDGEETLEAHKRARIEEKANRTAEDEEEKDKQVDAAEVAAVYGPGYYYGAAMPEDLLPANNILFIQNLPPETTEPVLVQLFSQFTGYKEVRLVPGKKDIAFVEYETEAQAGTAKQQLNGYKISEEKEMKVTYAKK
ncbi:hypothetical protein HDU85_000713 [Gaertneriomyces sp. JEL0708]|nr:hypothetical protein HDU85_000713 [Gaertneriomyces sp. JEL0708]